MISCPVDYCSVKMYPSYNLINSYENSLETSIKPFLLHSSKATARGRDGE
jgi:hypothetical protein